jgi:hypothetical protein
MRLRHAPSLTTPALIWGFADSTTRFAFCQAFSANKDKKPQRFFTPLCVFYMSVFFKGISAKSSEPAQQPPCGDTASSAVKIIISTSLLLVKCFLTFF